MDGNGLVLGAVEHEIGEQIVVPHPHDLENADGDHRRPQHREHDGEIGAQRTAAVDGGGLLDLQRDGLHEAHEHEDGKPRAEAEIDDGNGPGRVERDLFETAARKVKVGYLHAVGGLGEGEHDHLERHDHGKDAEVIDAAAELAVHAGDVPRGHRGAQQYQRRGDKRDEKAVKRGLPEGIVAEGDALDVVRPAGKALGGGQGKGLGLDIGVELEGVDYHSQHRQDVEDADEGQHDRKNGLAAAFGGKGTVHYCCTSFLRVARSWIKPMAATSRKNKTALACAVPRELTFCP